MFREMRRKRQQLSDEENLKILENASSGTLAVLGDDGYPYAVPQGFAYVPDEGGKLLFHCAKKGHLIDSLRRCDKVSFAVVSEDKNCPERYSTIYKSVIAFGTVKIIEDQYVIKKDMQIICDKYVPDGDPAVRDGRIDRMISSVGLLEMKIEHLTGKQAIEHLMV